MKVFKAIKNYITLMYLESLLNTFTRSFFKANRLSRIIPNHGRIFIFTLFLLAILSFDQQRFFLRYFLLFFILFFTFQHLLLKYSKPITISRTLLNQPIEQQPFDYEVKRNHLPNLPLQLYFKDISTLFVPTVEEFTNYTPSYLYAHKKRFRLLGYAKWISWVWSHQPILFSDGILLSNQYYTTVRAFANRRGKHYIRAQIQAYAWPWQLTRVVHYHFDNDYFIVWSKPLPLETSVFNKAIHLLDPLKSANTVGSSDEFRSLRPWRNGESIKQIDWKATAKRQAPIAKELQNLQSAQSIVFIDSQQPLPLLVNDLKIDQMSRIFMFLWEQQHCPIDEFIYNNQSIHLASSLLMKNFISSIEPEPLNTNIQMPSTFKHIFYICSYLNDDKIQQLTPYLSRMTLIYIGSKEEAPYSCINHYISANYEPYLAN